jgi:transposase-like protein
LFRKALKTQGRPPRVITFDRYAASHRAVRELPEEIGIWKDTKLRSSKYLNNIIEQDRRRVKVRIDPMFGFKRFHRAKVIIDGNLAKLSKYAQTAPAICNAVLTA